MTCLIQNVKKSSGYGKPMKSPHSVGLEGKLTILENNVGRIVLTMDELVSQLSKYGLGVAMDIPVSIPKTKKVKRVWHDISCNCYDCRAGISLRAKD